MNFEASVSDPPANGLAGKTVVAGPSSLGRVRAIAESFLPRGDSKVVFALVTAAYSAVCSQFLSAFLRAFVSENISRVSPFAIRHPLFHVCELLIIAPLVESLIVVGIITLMRKLGAPALVQVLTTAWLISATHFRPTLLHGVVVFPAFCIMAASYIYWRKKAGWKCGYLVIVVTHLLLNVTPALPYAGYAFRQR